MAQIKLTQGKYALVDDEDFEQLNKYKWYACANHVGDFYAIRNSKTVNGKRHAIAMHREILGLHYNDGKQGDHKNHNTLDNRHRNLRIATRNQNMHNSKSSVGTSKYKGVAWVQRDKKWGAYIRLNGKNKSLGYYTDEIKAAKAYDKAAKKLFSEFAFTNF